MGHFARTMHAQPNAAWADLTPLVGRAADHHDILELFKHSRLVTLTGPGGVGKSALALQVASALGKVRAVPVWVVDCADIQAPATIVGALLALIDIPERSEQSALLAIQQALQDQALVLVFDNGDQHIAAIARLATLLLPACSQLQLLVTSREAFAIPAEITWNVRPLEVPPAENVHDWPSIEAYSAVHLFVQRAQAAGVDLPCVPAAAPLVARLCRQLDGLPLALELAAARLKMLSLTQILDRLVGGLGLLAGGRRMAQQRHTSLDATFAWTYDLLDDAVQACFVRLAAIDCPFDLMDVEARCMDIPGDALTALTRLIGTSFVAVEATSEPVRYHLLETVRAFVRTRRQQADAASPPAAELHIHGLPQPMLASPPMPPTSAGLQALAFGPASVRRDGRLLTSSDRLYTKSKELLFYLLCHPVSSKEQIGLDFWPDMAPEQLRTNFHSTLYCLRHALGPGEWIVFVDQGYAINRALPIWFDVDMFLALIDRATQQRPYDSPGAAQSLEAAATLYCGEFLARISTSDWIVRMGDRLQQTYIAALDTLGKIALELHDPWRALRSFQRIVACEPLAEHGHRGMIATYLQLQDHGHALRHFHQWRQYLAKELGTVPAPETCELVAHL